ncbi:MAG: S8 family serine peptidase, partial [Thermohalobaculum sp.]|nr:S8 family serine peptidase [Thermohalobaculum sp.]
QVAVIDDGFDLGHADLAANFRTDLDYDYINTDAVPLPATGEGHGTAVSGIIGAAEGNGTGGVGVAWDVDLVGYRNAANLTLDDALLDAAGLGNGIGNTAGSANGSDVVNMSFGFYPLFLTDASFDAIVDAMAAGSAAGRDGLGTIFVKSSGNGRGDPFTQFREEATAERMNSSGFTINVGALRADGWVTHFSTPGANLLVSAFSNDTLNQTTILTTDLTGADGFAAGDTTSTFGGTSAAAPQVSGIVALMLQANPDLGWRDVQQILALGARHVGSAVGAAANTGAPAFGGFEQATQQNGASWFWNGATTWNGGGLHFSNDVGFGLVDAKAAVRLAETWGLQSTSANRVTVAHDLLNTTQAIADGNLAGRSFSTVSTSAIRLEHVSVELAMTVEFLADLVVYLTSPAGTRVQLVANTGGADAFSGRWSFGTTALMGEASAGTWTVTVIDSASGDAITVSDIVLRLNGAAASENDLRVFTEEFSEVADSAGHVRVFDGGAGTDALNAAAIDSASVVDLAAGTGIIDGVAVTLASIEEVFTGDGNDRLTGTAAAERLEGGRGHDTLSGGGGADILRGGRGDDLLVFDAASTSLAGALFDGGNGHDALVIGGNDAAVHDFRGADLASIEEFRFVADGTGLSRTAIFDAQEFDAVGEVSPTLVVRGNDAAGSVERIEIVLGVNQTLDLSAWTFQGWGAQGEQIHVTGDGSDETLVTSSQADVIASGAGNDRIVAGAGNDRIDGGLGRDTIDAGSGDDIVTDADGLATVDTIDSLDGGLGIDTLVAIGAWTSGATFDLAAGALTNGAGLSQIVRNFENLTVSGAARVIGTAAANTFVITADFASAGNMIVAGGGNDVVTAAAGADTIDAGDGRDTVSAGAGNDVITGGDGNDRLLGDDGNDWIDGGTGNDVLWGGMGFDTLLGGDGDDILQGHNGGDLLDGGVGRDMLVGGNGSDRMFGGADDDTLDGGGGSDRLEGGDGNDRLIGWFGRDQLIGGAGDDSLEGGAHADVLWGGDGADTLLGMNGDDRMMAGAGDDFLNGALDNDDLQGGPGNDRLLGGQGDDTLTGGEGDDVLDGGTGADRFVFNSDTDGHDRINNFENGVDLIAFDGLGGIANFASLEVVRQGSSSLVTAGLVSVLVVGVAVDLIDADDFLFA